MHTANSDQLGVALIGLGMVSSTYIDALSSISEKVTLVGVLGSRPASPEIFKRKHNLNNTVRAYKSIDEIAHDDNVHFVLLTTPPNARKDIVTTLAAAGKPILMEKPVERTIDAATELCVICESADIALGIMLQHRARPSAQQLLNKLASEDFGALRAVEISVPWWRDQAYYDEPGRGSYQRDGGGVLISQAIHALDLALQFTGPVASVHSLNATTDFHSMESEDFVSAGIRFSNGAVGNLIASTACFPGRSECLYLHYANVSVRLESNQLELNWHDGKVEQLGEAAASGAGADPMAFTSDWHRFMIENFVDVITGDATPIATGRSSLPVHQLIHALEQSSKTGATVELKKT